MGVVSSKEEGGGADGRGVCMKVCVWGGGACMCYWLKSRDHETVFSF